MRQFFVPSKSVVTLLAMVGLGIFVLPASAQQVPSGQVDVPVNADVRDVGVMDRDRPAYDAKGVPLGGFRLFPVLAVDLASDDNVFSTPSRASDVYLNEQGTVRLASQWGRHFLEAFAGVNNVNYNTYSDLDLTDWNFGTDGRYDIQRGSALAGGGTYGDYHEPLYSPNTAGNQLSPTRYFKGHSEVTATYALNRLSLKVAGSYDRLNYQFAHIAGGGVINNNDRDENEFQGYLRSQYDFSPGYSGFMKLSYDGRNFDKLFDRNGYHRNSTGFRYDAGVDLQITHLVQGEIYVGYLQQDFDQHLALRLKDVSGLDFGGQLDWFVDPLVTFHLTGSRQFSDTVLGGVSASSDETVRLSADYELAYNIIVQGYGQYTYSHLEGETREDQYPGGGVSVRYLINNYLSADFKYRYNERISNVVGVGFDDNIFSIGLTGHI